MNESESYLKRSAETTEIAIYRLIECEQYYHAFSKLILCHTALFREITNRNPNLKKDLTSKLRGE